MYDLPTGIGAQVAAHILIQRGKDSKTNYELLSRNELMISLCSDLHWGDASLA